MKSKWWYSCQGHEAHLWTIYKFVYKKVYLLRDNECWPSSDDLFSFTVVYLYLGGVSLNEKQKQKQKKQDEFSMET